MPTYKELRDTLLELAGQDAGGEFEDMTKRAVNRTYRRLLSEVNQDETRREFSLSTSASTSQYGMPLGVSRILNIEDGTARRRLRELTPTEFDRLYPGTTSTGDARQFYVFGAFGVQTQPTAGTITVVSSSASDDSDFFIRIQGTDSNGTWQSEQVTMNGTTDVTTTASFSTIEQIAKSANSGNTWTGIVTVSDSAASVLTRIPQATTSPTHLWVEFYPIPDDTRTLTVRSMSRKPDLLNDNDWPQLHEDWHELVVLGAGPELMIAAGKPNQAQRMLAEFQDMLPRMKARVQYRPSLKTFRNIQNQPGFVPDDRPLIQGVDFV